MEVEDYSHNCSHFVEGNHMVDPVEVDTHSHFHKLCKYLCNKIKLLKFSFSEKATKICAIVLMVLMFTK